MQISTKTGVVHAMLSSFDAPKTLGQGGRNSNTVARRIAVNIANLPELLSRHKPGESDEDIGRHTQQSRRSIRQTRRLCLVASNNARCIRSRQASSGLSDWK